MSRNMEKILKQVLQENISQVGLFWFSKDYQKITEIQGTREISNSDLLKPDRIDPIGVHAEYDMPRDQPRGRISYMDSIFKINVGEDCEIDDSTITSLVKNNFGLTILNDSKFKIVKHWHWNTKTN